MNVVNKTSSAVAVSDSLTTLIDWTNIQNFAGFTLIVTNLGGGSGNDITDVTIDTSSDGITADLDQHAGVPAVPITAGNSPSETFTETANFIRVRATCATDQDTTATAILLADSAAARLCTLDDVKRRLGILDLTEHDILINNIIAGIGDLFDAYTNRTLLMAATDQTEYYTGAGRRLQLRRYPITSITSIKVAADYDFDSVDSYTLNTDYRIVNGGLKGVIYSIGCSFPNYDDCVQLIYNGGYCGADITPASGQYALPWDLRDAAICQAILIFQRRNDLGLSGNSFDGGSITKFTSLDLLPLTKRILDSYRRHTL